MIGGPLTLYNSLSRSLEPFEPIDPANVRVYSCGPTVYHYAHIGNLRAYVFTDTLGRVLRWKGYPLTHVVNITDVGHLTSDADTGDDKMEARARELGRDIWAIARHYTDAFKRNIQDLNIRPPSLYPLATDHVAEMIAFAEAIGERHCYRLPDGLYFDIGTVPDYGGLARSREDEGEGRIAPVAGKHHPQDFAIWRTTAPGQERQMSWPSPWGSGAPGWHLECSVMSRKYLGARFDIHTGGVDHREIHHPNEIAQNQAYSGCAHTGANWWMHNNFLVERSGKMSKSSGDFLTLSTLTARGFHPLAYRLLCLQAHYRSELEFSWESLAAALTRLKRLVYAVETLRSTEDATPPDPERTRNYRQRLDAALSDDLGTPKALPVLDELLGDKRLSATERLSALRDFDDLLGLDLLTLRREDLRVRPADASFDAEEIEARLTQRRNARAARNFTRSDALRDALTAGGVEIMDGDRLGWEWAIRVPETASA